MRSLLTLAAVAGFQSGFVTAVSLNVSAFTSGEVESDWTATYYAGPGEQPLLIGNDGGASTGGFHVWDLNGDSPLEASKSLFTGRAKLVSTLYDIGGKDYLVSIPMTTSELALYELPAVTKVDDAGYVALGDWSALCTWKSPSKNNYVFIFGKTEGIQFLVREADDSVEILRVQTFDIPAEMAGCAVSQAESKLFLSPDGGNRLYAFDLAESTKTPELSVIGEVEDEITGVTVYVSKKGSKDYLLVALEKSVSVYEYPWTLVGSWELSGVEEPEIQGISLYQASTSKYPEGVLAYAIEGEDVLGFGLSSLENALSGLNIEPNVEYNPRNLDGCIKHSPITEKCSFNGFSSNGTCDCLAGFTGEACDEFKCEDDCSGNGSCVGPDTCQCEEGWGGLHCSFVLVEPEYETDANGSDGDDPAIWISPKSPELSRIITTTKAGDGAGLAVFDLQGKQLQMHYSSKPNNVDVIYNFQAGNRTVDLAFAACRGDNTLCIFEITSDGEIKDIPGGIQPSYAEDEVYGSCVYRSKTTGKQYLFVNEKSARYMQYELTATSNGTLHTELVREFVGGSGGQVEGCVSDEDNGWLILGEEPSALWRYDAEPDGGEEGYEIAHVGDGNLYGDVEGVTLVQGKSKDEGFIINSCQGVSAYNVYKRAAPHDYVMTFTITDSADGEIDHVSNTDGLAMVGVNLGPEFPNGLLVVHDDTNELPGGKAADPNSSYKLVSLDKILAAGPFKDLNLMDEVDPNWDPRA
ncbi:unnamed protein product [Clonostachys rosea]|uniref:3-phytase n=1 Tax=Bionectria ochroleuca TaxID=29856 RepID=A0ABY6TP14_BIOOC|nr:unnamed protein product [Clonostachys rosea]